jgi:hypothetical protein
VNALLTIARNSDIFLIMFDLIKLMLDITIKIVPGASSWRREKRLNRIGADLFYVYIMMNEIITLGEAIISGLEEIVESFPDDGTAESVTHEVRVHPELRIRIRRQWENLIIIFSLLNRYSKELQVLDAVSYRRLFLLIKGKESFLRMISVRLAMGRSPLGSARDMIDAMDEYAVNHSPDYMSVMIYQTDMTNEMISVPPDGNWTQYDRSSLALVIEKARAEQLQAIESEMTRLRESLEKTFKLSDVLLVVSREDARGRMSEILWPGNLPSA